MHGWPGHADEYTPGWYAPGGGATLGAWGGEGGWGSWLQDFLGTAASYWIAQDQANDALKRYEAWVAQGQPASGAPPIAADTTPTWQLVAYGVGATALVGLAVWGVVAWRRRK